MSGSGSTLGLWPMWISLKLTRNVRRTRIAASVNINSSGQIQIKLILGGKRSLKNHLWLTFLRLLSNEVYWCNQWWYVEERSRDTDLNNVIKGSTGPKQDTKHYQPTSS